LCQRIVDDGPLIRKRAEKAKESKMSSAFDHSCAVRVGTPGEFARLAEVLKAASFDEETVCRTLKLHDMSDVGSVSADAIDFANVSPQFKLLTRLFLSPSLVPRADVEAVLDAATIDAFLSSGLLGTGEFGADDFYARVLLYPVGDFFIASDRHSMPDGSPFEAPPDIVFPAIYVGTLHFLRLLPTSEAGDVLDLCAGSGIGALVLSRRSRRAVSADLTARATQFARFNRALNNCENVEVVQGDLYDAVAGRTFDRIVAHPPYVPSLGLAQIYRDGGATGEALIRRIVEGLPLHLRAGGIFCALSQGLDTKDGQFEDRVRGWLGDRGKEFDIIFAVDEERQPRNVLKNLADRHQIPGASVKELTAEFERAGVLKMPYGALFIRRATSAIDRQPWTVRRKLSDATDGADLESAFAVHDRLTRVDFNAELTESKPQLAPRLQVKVTHVVHERGLVPADFIFETDKPFAAFGRFDAWMVPLMARFDGGITPKKIYEDARANDEMPEDFRLEDFAALVTRAIEAGYLVLA
jgi:SAM-dependent methyltransferase